MGVVIRQSFWGTFIAYLGVLIGYLNTLYLRPEFLSLDQIGLFNLVTANAMLISPFCAAGMPGTTIKYFPVIKTDTILKNQFFTFQMTVVLVLNVVVLSLLFGAEDFVKAYFSENSPDYHRYLGITAIVIVSNSVFALLFAYCRAFLNVIVPSFIRDVFLRVGAIILILGFAAEWWNFDWMVKGLAINYSLAFVILLVYLMLRFDLKFYFSFSRIDKAWRWKIFDFGWYTMFLALTFAIMNNVSYLQVAGELGDRANGIFTTCFFIGVIVEMPQRNMVKILSPLISEAIQKSEWQKVNGYYRKGSITMSIFGMLLLIGILTNVNDLFAFIPQGNGFREGFWIVVSVCAAKFILMLFSFSQEILVFSKHYKYLLLFQASGAVILIILNYFLIPLWGLTGAGVSYLIAVFIYALIKFFFIRNKYQLLPFGSEHLRLFLIGALLLVMFWFLPFPFTPIINIFVRAVLTTLIFVLAIYKAKLSDDINQLIRRTFEKNSF